MRNGGVVENISSLIGPKMGVAAASDDRRRLLVVLVHEDSGAVEKKNASDDDAAASRVANVPVDFTMVADE